MRFKPERILRFFFPYYCYSCGCALPDGIFCPDCAADLQEIALSPHAILQPEKLILHQWRDEIALDGVCAAFCYYGSARQALLRFKFRGLPKIGCFFGAKMADKVRYCYRNLTFDAIAFVPQMKDVYRTRGFNQAEVLAVCLGEKLSLPVMHCLRKIKKNQKQHTLSAAQRQENVRGIYAATPDVKGKTILLVDDIQTTGATLNSCAKVLKRKGAVGVFAVVAARR